jgi:hypothetical protein
MKARSETRSRSRSVLLPVIAVLLMAAAWILFVGTTRSHEMWVGCGAVLLSGAFLAQVRKAEALKLDLRIVDLAQGWRIPWYVVSDTWQVVLVLLKDLSGIQSAQSLYRVCGFRAGEGDDRSVARSVLTILFTTCSPNMIVLGIDTREQRMLFHQLKASSIPKMAQNLGAQSGAER